MHPHEEPRKRKAAIASKGVRHPAAGGHDGRRGKEQADEREKEQANRASVTIRSVLEDLAERGGSGVDGFVDITGDEEEDDEEDEAGEGTDADAVDHDLWPFDGCVGDLLDHVGLQNVLAT